MPNWTRSYVRYVEAFNYDFDYPIDGADFCDIVGGVSGGDSFCKLLAVNG